MERSVDQWNYVLVHLVIRRLDHETRRRWVMSLPSTDIPKFHDLVSFMDKYIRSLVAEGTGISSTSMSHQYQSQQQKGRQGFYNNVNKKVSAHHGGSSQLCQVCKASHPLFKCEKFLGMQPNKRSNEGDKPVF